MNMKKTAAGAAALLLSSAPVFAAGIERANQSINVLFEEGNYLEIGIQNTNPDVDGRDLDIPQLGYSGRDVGGVAANFNAYSFAYKHQFTDKISGALIVDQPYGTDVNYPDLNPTSLTQGSFMLGGTKANVQATMITGILRYKFNDSWGVHGGARISKASADIRLNGAAYGGAFPQGISGYRAKMKNDTAAGWLIGGSWERPDIAARVALTYYSKIKHKFDTTERIGETSIFDLDPTAGPSGIGGKTDVDTPRMIALDFQTGVAPKVLVFGQVRRTYWSDFKVAPPWFGARISEDGLVSLEDTNTFTIGSAYKFNDNWSGLVSYMHEPKGDKLVSPLAPTNGRNAITVGGIYTQDHWKLTGAVNYTKLGNAYPETGTPDVARAKMKDNSALTFALRLGYRF